MQVQNALKAFVEDPGRKGQIHTYGEGLLRACKTNKGCVVALGDSVVLGGSPKELNEAFRAAMRRFASTVTIITATDGQRQHGMTATAVTSLSMDPPALLGCVNQKALLHDIMAAGTHFCVNVLHRDQAELSSAFSGAVPAAERFGLGAWIKSERGVPYLEDAQAALFCRKTDAIPYSTHTIFIGVVEQVALKEAIAPLVYQDANYCVAAALGEPV